MDDRSEILLVEDNPDDIKLAMRAFEKHRLANHVTVLRDGAEALDFLFRRGRIPTSMESRFPNSFYWTSSFHSLVESKYYEKSKTIRPPR